MTTSSSTSECLTKIEFGRSCRIHSKVTTSYAWTLFSDEWKSQTNEPNFLQKAAAVLEESFSRFYDIDRDENDE